METIEISDSRYGSKSYIIKRKGKKINLYWDAKAMDREDQMITRFYFLVKFVAFYYPTSRPLITL